MLKIENLIKLLPLGSIYVILCSSIKLVIFYKCFNISIVDYIQIQEYLTLFIDDILYYLVVFGIGILLYLFNIFQYSEHNYIPKSEEPEKYKKERNFTLNLSIIIIILVIILSNTCIYRSKSIEIISVGGYFVLCLLYVYLSSTKITFPYPLLIITSIVLYTISNGFIDAYKILENKDKLNYTLGFKDRNYSTDRTIKYLGKTENFIFLYNLKSKRTTILKIDDLVKIGIKETLSKDD